MAYDHSIVAPGKTSGTVLSQTGETLFPPHDWEFLPAGDAAITRSVKAKGTTWVVQVRRGRRMISKGVWANAAHILESREKVQAKRATPEYNRQRKRELARRGAKQTAYVIEFCKEVVNYLNFHPKYETQASVLAEKITEHATPVGSGTVARTQRIPVAQRAEAAVIAWMRHGTTAYESMKIARVTGRRREVRRQLAAKSVEVLQDYRQGGDIPSDCPLKRALTWDE